MLFSQKGASPRPQDVVSQGSVMVYFLTWSAIVAIGLRVCDLCDGKINLVVLVPTCTRIVLEITSWKHQRVKCGNVMFAASVLH